MASTEEKAQAVAVSEPKADHLCILVHGFKGYPKDVDSLAIALRGKFPEDKLHILKTKSNTGSLSWDGTKMGGERVTAEIEDELARLEKAGNPIKKLSLVGYSQGGLIARYCVGLLFSRGCFAEGKLEPVNFTAFASPFLGVRKPLKERHADAYNSIGPLLASSTGKDFFLMDSYRGTGRSVLEVMADPADRYYKGLSLFRSRVLYANVLNDTTAGWFTTAIEDTDPYEIHRAIVMNFMPGYKDVLLDPANPFRRKAEAELADTPEEEPPVEIGTVLRNWKKTSAAIRNILRYLVKGQYENATGVYRAVVHGRNKRFAAYDDEDKLVAAPAASLAAAIASAPTIATIPDAALIETNKAIPQQQAEGAGPLTQESAHEAAQNPTSTTTAATIVVEGKDGFPVLALSEQQKYVVKHLNELGWRKFPCFFHRDVPPHAAIVVREKEEAEEEGYEVLRHWVDEVFEV